MVIEEVIALFRRRLRDLDPTEYEYEEEDLLHALKDAKLLLSIKQLPGLSAYTVAGGDITPEPTDEHTMLLVTKGCLDLLQARYRDMLRRGEFGVTWRSGLEEESSVAASQKYAQMLDALDLELQELIHIQRRATFAFRAQ